MSTFSKAITFSWRSAFAACLAAVIQSSLGQIPACHRLRAAPSKPSDQLGRDTPYGTVLRISAGGAVGRLQHRSAVSADERRHAARPKATALAMEAECGDERAFAGNLRPSRQPEGTPQEDVPPGRQKLGTMSSGDVEARTRTGSSYRSERREDLADLFRHFGQSSRTLRSGRSAAGRNAIAEVGGEASVGGHAAVAMVRAAAADSGGSGGGLAAVGCAADLHCAGGRGDTGSRNWCIGVRSPARHGCSSGTIVHTILATYLRMPLLQRHYYTQVTAVAVIIGANWILWRVVRWFLRRVRNRALARGHGGTGSLMLLGERMIKAFIFVMALFFVLGVLGFNMTTALAGVGIGTLAVGFGAQQTIANLFGGVSVLGDEVIRVGDVCKFGDRTGTVEDIGLRSTRVRTEERTLLAIPNGTVATINVENLSRRDKILFKTVLGLHLDTSPDHLRAVLSEIRRVLAGPS